MVCCVVNQKTHIWNIFNRSVSSWRVCRRTRVIFFFFLFRFWLWGRLRFRCGFRCGFRFGGWCRGGFRRWLRLWCWFWQRFWIFYRSRHFPNKCFTVIKAQICPLSVGCRNKHIGIDISGFIHAQKFLLSVQCYRDCTVFLFCLGRFRHTDHIFGHVSAENAVRIDSIPGIQRDISKGRYRVPNVECSSCFIFNRNFEYDQFPILTIQGRLYRGILKIALRGRIAAIIFFFSIPRHIKNINCFILDRLI